MQVQQLEDIDLPDRGIAIDVEYSDVNFKDGLCITGTLGLVETFPVTAGMRHRRNGDRVHRFQHWCW